MADLSDPEDETPRLSRRRALWKIDFNVKKAPSLNIVKNKTKDLIRENNKLYNTFMIRTVPISMRHYEIELDD